MNTLEEKAFWHYYHSFIKEGQRNGQAYMNALRYAAPELYDMVSGSMYDCFYNDRKVNAFRRYMGL